MIETGYIQTVTSKINKALLGYCQSHEHLFIADGLSAKIVPSLLIDCFDKTCSELNMYKGFGGKSIVDAQPPGCGRMADLLLKASIETGVNIIASTGFHKLCFYEESHWINDMDSDELARLYISELTEGMYIRCDEVMPKTRLAAKAGVIKTASDIDGPVLGYEKLFTAASKAHIETGAPIMSHTEMGKCALEQIDFFVKNGVSESSLIICHIDRNLKDYDYLFKVLETGVFVELDTIGRAKYHSDEDEVDFIYALVEKGYEDKILLGLDTTRERLKSYGAAIGLDYLFEHFFQLLERRGITSEIINKFTVENPSQAFEVKKNQ